MDHKLKKSLGSKPPTKVIFRPWDKDQDATISSTTVGSSNINLIEKNESSDGNCDLKCDQKILSENKSSVPMIGIYGETTIPQTKLHSGPPSPTILPSLQHHTQMDYGQALATSFYYQHSVPMVDPFVMGSMEQEYYRVLSEEAQTKMLNMRKQRPKKFKCPHCDVAFSNNGQLKGHIRIHTGERPFKCDDPSCGKTFTRNEELTRHKRIHTGVRPFPCATCGKRFGRRDHLKKHTKTHFVHEKYLSPTAIFLPMCPPYIYGY